MPRLALFDLLGAIEKAAPRLDVEVDVQEIARAIERRAWGGDGRPGPRAAARAPEVDRQKELRQPQQGVLTVEVQEPVHGGDVGTLSQNGYGP